MKRGTGATADAIVPVVDIARRLDASVSELADHDTGRRLTALFESLLTQGIQPWLSFPFHTPTYPPTHRRYAVGAVDGVWNGAGDLTRNGEPVTGFQIACATIGVAESVAMTARAVGLAAARYRSTVEIALPRG